MAPGSRQVFSAGAQRGGDRRGRAPVIGAAAWPDGRIREATLEGLDAAALKGNHRGRPAIITDDMLHTVLAAGRRRVHPARPDHPHRER